MLTVVTPPRLGWVRGVTVGRAAARWGGGWRHGKGGRKASRKGGGRWLASRAPVRSARVGALFAILDRSRASSAWFAAAAVDPQLAAAIESAPRHSIGAAVL